MNIIIPIEIALPLLIVVSTAISIIFSHWYVGRKIDVDRGNRRSFWRK